MLDKLKAIWEFLDGKKLAIGATLLAVGQLLANVESTWAIHTPFLDGAVAFLNEWGTKVTNFGLAHKAVKILETEPAKQ